VLFFFERDKYFGSSQNVKLLETTNNFTFWDDPGFFIFSGK